MFQNELALSYNINSESKALAFNLAQSREYMLKYQLVALAKFHNDFGAIDSYMREFVRLNIGNSELERLLNAEVCVVQRKDSLFLKDTQGEPEVDPNVLAQPDFQFLPGGMKARQIEKYKKLVTD